MLRIFLTLFLLAPTIAMSASPSQLASECQRGFNDSCRALRAMNANNPQQDLTGNDVQKTQLADECRRGFSASCTALRALNGEKPPHRTVCSTSGYAADGGYGSSYNGTTVCREVQ